MTTYTLPAVIALIPGKPQNPRREAIDALRANSIKPTITGQDEAGNKQYGYCRVCVDKMIAHLAPTRSFDDYDPYEEMQERKAQRIEALANPAEPLPEWKSAVDLKLHGIKGKKSTSVRKLPKIPLKSKYSDDLRQKAANRYMAGESAAVIARECGTYASVVRTWVVRYGGEIRPITKKEMEPSTKPYYSPAEKAQAVEAYKNGATAPQIAQTLGASNCAVARWVRESGNEVRSKGCIGQDKVSNDQRRDVVRRYLGGEGGKELAEEFGVSISTIKRWKGEMGK